MLLLIFIYYFKSILSINDIQSLLAPLTERFFHTENDLQLDRIYTEVFSLEKSQIEILKEDLVQKYRLSENTFSDASGEDREFLQLFRLICMLSFDVYMKKQVIEKLIDQFPERDKPSKKNHKEKEARVMTVSFHFLQISQNLPDFPDPSIPKASAFFVSQLESLSRYFM